MINSVMKKKISSLLEGKVEWDCPLASYTSFKIGGPADGLATVETRSQLQDLLPLLQSGGVDWFVIGRGTNLLVADQGVAGLILILGKGLSEMKVLEVEKKNEREQEIHLRVGAGCGLGHLTMSCANDGYGGLEFLNGIPGSLGGAVVMNGGAFGSELADVLRSVTVVSESGEVKTFKKSQLEFTYRCWNDFKKSIERWVVICAELCCTRMDREELIAKLKDFRKRRLSSQPKGMANAGSFFKNPKGDAAGRLIDVSGLKGLRVGDAMVSEVHGNFIVNCGNATAENVVTLMKKIQEKIKNDFGIELQPEVQFLTR